MKFKNYLNESNDNKTVTDWIAKYCSFIDNNGTVLHDIDAFQIAEDGSLFFTDLAATILIEARDHYEVLEIPNLSKWSNSAGAFVHISRFSIKDAKVAIPSCYQLEIADCKIAKFKLDPSKFGNLDKIEIIRNTELNCGLLSLLKLPALFEIEREGCSEKLEKALKIVESHLHERDIPACQQELIEAGLKEYATL